MPLCILDGGCSGQMTIEHNGDVYGCDHFVERRWQLAQVGRPEWRNAIELDGSERIGLTIHGTGYAPNAAHEGLDIHTADDLAARYGGGGRATDDDALDTEWFQRADTRRLAHFSARKQGNLPEKCQACDYRHLCHGGCPEHRPHGGDRNEASVLCPGYIHFYSHALERLEWLAGYLRGNQQPPPVEANVQAGAATDSAIGRRMRIPAGTKPGRNDPCPCGSGLKYKSCCGRG
jgi:radical SAM protein with 4Fe4S-binding SPASM domain